MYEQIRDSQAKILGADHPSTLTTQTGLAVAYQAAGRFRGHHVVGADPRGPGEDAFSADHPSTLLTQANLAAAYWSAKQLDKSVPLFEDTLKRQEAKLGRQHPDTQVTVANLSGSTTRMPARLKEAIPLLEEAYHASRSVPDLRFLSRVHYSDGYLKARRCFRGDRVVGAGRDTQVKTLGADHPDTLRTQGNLAAAYWSARQLDKSVPLFEDLLQRQEARLGRQHVDTQRTVGNLGVNYKDAGRLKEAIPLLEEAYRASRSVPNLRFVEGQLLDGYLKAGMTTEAAKLVQNQVADACKVLPRDSPQLAGTLTQSSLTLLQLKAYVDAEPLLRECLTIREKTQPELWTTFNTQSLLGAALSGQKKYAEAEPLLLAGYDGMKQREKTIPPQGRVRLLEAVERLVQFYEATDKKEEVVKWLKILDEARSAEKKPAVNPEKQP